MDRFESGSIIMLKSQSQHNLHSNMDRFERDDVKYYVGGDKKFTFQYG